MESYSVLSWDRVSKIQMKLDLISCKYKLSKQAYAGWESRTLHHHTVFNYAVFITNSRNLYYCNLQYCTVSDIKCNEVLTMILTNKHIYMKIVHSVKLYLLQISCSINYTFTLYVFCLDSNESSKYIM